MPIKKAKQSTVRCRECDATSQEAFLEKIKGTNEYICDDCASDMGSSGSYRDHDDEDDYDGDFDGSTDDYSDGGYDVDDDDY